MRFNIVKCNAIVVVEPLKEWKQHFQEKHKEKVFLRKPV